MGLIFLIQAIPKAMVAKVSPSLLHLKINFHLLLTNFIHLLIIIIHLLIITLIIITLIIMTLIIMTLIIMTFLIIMPNLRLLTLIFYLIISS
jgi:hypothetical protein